MKTKTHYSILSLCLFNLLIFSCQSYKEEKVNDKIAEAIAEDLEDGLPHRTELQLDLPNLPAKKYSVDKEHSSISFRTKHWEIVDLIGWFSDFDVIMHADEADFSDAVILAKVYPNSIVMPNEKMMGSARQFPYIDSKAFPEMIFQSTEMKKLNDNNYLLHGHLEVNGIKKEMNFDVISNGFAYPNEKSICGFDVTGTINRHDFKIAGQSTLHSGRLIHADSIDLHFALRME